MVQIDEYPEVAAAVAAGFGSADTHTSDAVLQSEQSAHQQIGEVADQANKLRLMVQAQSEGAELNVTRDAVGRQSAPLVAIASGKGGVGKSTLALNLGIASGRPSTLIDLDLGTANLDVLCGVAPTNRIDAQMFASSELDLSKLVEQTKFGFQLVAGAAGVAHAAMLEATQRQRLLRAVQRLGIPGELTIADLGAGIGPSVIETVADADLGVIVTTPDPASVADAYAIIKCVVRHRKDPRPLRMGLVVSMAESRSAGRETHARVDRVCKRFLGGSIPLLGVVRRDERVVQATRRREPLLARRVSGPAQRDFRSLSAFIGMLAPRAGRLSGLNSRS